LYITGFQAVNTNYGGEMFCPHVGITSLKLGDPWWGALTLNKRGGCVASPLFLLQLALERAQGCCKKEKAVLLHGSLI
jgi:hypothetical protein